MSICIKFTSLSCSYLLICCGVEDLKKPHYRSYYRVGGEGCVDVIYTRMIETASGGSYYADHLPLVGKYKVYLYYTSN
jgi:hypothetical protein